MNKRAGQLFLYLLAVVALIAGWKALATLLSSAVLPQPEAAIAAFVQALATRAFWDHFAASALRAVVAMGAAWGIGFPIGILMGGSRRVDTLLSPLVFLTYPVPKIVFLPVILLLFGLGNTSKIVMISLILGYQVLVTTRDGVRNIPPEYLDSIRSLGASRWQVMREVYFPAALPYGFTSLRINSGVSVAVLFFVESFATTRGLGYLIMDAWGRMNYEEMFVGIFGMSVLGVLLFESANVLEKRGCAWKRAGKRK